MRADGSCIAWWYLRDGGNRHCFIAAFVSNRRDEFFVEIADGFLNQDSFAKDDHITKPSWSFTLDTRRQTLARVLKYGEEIESARRAKGFRLNLFSYSIDTGTLEDVQMARWQGDYDDYLRVTRPAWWPIGGNINYPSYSSTAKSKHRLSVDDEGFDFQALVGSVGLQRRRKKVRRDNIIRRVGRFTVFFKERKDAPY